MKVLIQVCLDRRTGMAYRKIQKLLLTIGGVGLFAMPAYADAVTTRYPWIVKPQTELTEAECTAAMQHDYNYWWAHGKCHMRFIRYAWGVAIKDVAAKENPDSITKKGELLKFITQYQPAEGTYCEHGGYCYPAKDVKLLGSVLAGPDTGENKAGGEADPWQGVSTACELIFADRTNIIEANAQEMFKDCH